MSVVYREFHLDPQRTFAREPVHFIGTLVESGRTIVKVNYGRRALSSYITCEACSEENKLGSTRCARCGAVLEVTEDTVDPELADFNVALAELAEKNRQERRDRLLKDIAATGGWALGPR
jgi:hypothetical protein